MNAAQMIHAATDDGVRLALTDEGGLHYAGDPGMVKEWLPILKENKAAIVAELHSERRRAKVLAMLGDGRKYAVLVENDKTDPVICTVAIRGIASFEMAIPKHSYNGFVLLELVEKHSAEPSQSSGDTNPSHATQQRSQAHHGKRLT